MLIHEIHLRTSKLQLQREFYSSVLGLPVRECADSAIQIQIGQSMLRFEQDATAWQGCYHFAFNIPENQLYDGKEWLADRASLVSDRSGNDEFHFNDWNAKAIYFTDPVGNVVELIARHDLHNSASTAFGAQSLLCVSEIGLVTETVTTAAQRLISNLGEGIYRETAGENFAAIGDESGLLIVVQNGREWYPDTRRYAGLTPVRLVVSSGGKQRQNISGPPYGVN